MELRHCRYVAIDARYYKWNAHCWLVNAVTQISVAVSKTRWQSYPVETDFSNVNLHYSMLHILKHRSLLVYDEYDVEAFYDVTNHSICVTISRQCCRTKYFEPGWKLTQWAFFQHWILRPEVLNFDPSPLRIELRRGIYYFDHEPCSKFNSIKTSNI
jgi:hypothetical protein